MIDRRDFQIHMIPLKLITIVNPRERGRKKFQQIVDNIDKVGLRKPITVTPKPRLEDPQEYFLVCGQGRYEAYEILGEDEIPAIIVHVSKEELLLMSLVENLARRQYSTVELVREIGRMRERGDNFAEIARKTGLDTAYVRSIVKLLKQGEERLVQAVEKGQIPISVAMTIACSEDHAIQRALTEAYESNDLRGKKLLATRQLVERRRTNGKSIRGGPRHQNGDSISSKKLLKTYQEETAKQRMVIKKAKLCETRLLFIVTALKQLSGDELFVQSLKTESLDTMPAYLTQQFRVRRDQSCQTE